VNRDELEEQLRASWSGQRWSDAATQAIEGYGPDIVRYLAAILRNEQDITDAYARFCEYLWVALPRFRGESSFRTWLYALARHAGAHVVRDPARRAERRVPLSDAGVLALAEQVRTRTLTFLRTEKKDRLAELRDRLSADDQTLLILRVDRAMEWRDIARVIGDLDDDSDDALKRRAAALRKRFERLKADLREHLRDG
jgi:RNA polymerase sigma-70 factor (ECF subfamily)